MRAFFGGGSLYAYIALITLGGGLVWGFADYYYDKGKADCAAAQLHTNSEVKDLGVDLENQLETIDDEHDDTSNQIDRDYRAGLSYLDVENARRQGIRDGKAFARAQAILAEKKKSDSCLNDNYADGRQLLNDARSLQFDIFGDSLKSNRAGNAEQVPILAGSKAVPDAPASGYKQPD